MVFTDEIKLKDLILIINTQSALYFVSCSFDFSVVFRIYVEGA